MGHSVNHRLAAAPRAGSKDRADHRGGAYSTTLSSIGLVLADPPCLPRRWSCDLRPERASPDYPDHLSNVPCPLPPGGSERVHVSVASPFHAAFSDSQAGRHPQHHFRGLLRLHSRYGPPDRSTARGGLCHEASKRPVTDLADRTAVVLAEVGDGLEIRLQAARQPHHFHIASRLSPAAAERSWRFHRSAGSIIGTSGSPPEHRWDPYEGSRVATKTPPGLPWTRRTSCHAESIADGRQTNPNPVS